MTARAFVHAAAWWDDQAGPPRAELLPRDERLAASFATRMLAHVLDEVASRSAWPLAELPWVLGSATGAHEPSPSLRRAAGPCRGLALVHAGPATVAMALFEALATLVDHDAVLVAFADDATPPHHEALAAALVLSRAPSDRSALVLDPPAPRRTPSHSRRTTEHPLAAARALARAAMVGQPTVETVTRDASDRPDRWHIELRRGF